MLPKLHSTNFPGMELIRPLYLVREESINRFWQYNGYTFINCACKFTENNNIESNSKRLEIKKLLNELREKSDVIDNNIFKSTEKVNLETLISYQDDGKITSFLDRY